MSNANSPVALTQARLQMAPSTREVLDLPEVESNWIRTYEQVTGKKDGAQRFQAEKIMFMQVTSANNFKNVEKFSLYSAFVELAISGLTLRDGLSYIIPFGKTATFMPGWKGRLEQINEMPDVSYVHEPQVVHADDDFQFELGMSPKIIKHVPKDGSTAALTYVYLVIEFAQGSKVYIMSASECLNIRNRFSQSYKTYINECARANMAVGSTFTKTIQGNNGSWEATIEPPMWITDEIQAFKKTLVKRTYNNLPKLGKHKHIDAAIKNNMGEGAEHEDPESYNQYLQQGPDQEQGDQQAEVISSNLGSSQVSRPTQETF